MDGGCLTDMEKDDINAADFPAMKPVRAASPIQECTHISIINRRDASSFIGGSFGGISKMLRQMV